MVDPTKNSAIPLRTLTPATASDAKAGSPTGAKPAPQQTQPQGAAKPATAQKAPAKAAAIRKPANFSSVPFWAGVGLSAFWVALVAFAMMQAGGTHTFAGLPLVNWAIGISAIVSPVAMIWMVTAYMQRAADVQSVTEPLRRQLAMVIGESGAAEVRIRRFNQAVREQLDLLRSTQALSQGDLMDILNRVRQHREELDQFEQHSLHHVKDIQDVIRRSLQQIEQVMDDKFTMLRVLDGKLVQSGDSVMRQTDQVHEQVSTLLHEIETNAQQVSSALERAMIDSRKLADTARAQEASLLGAAATASTTLQDLSGKIDVNIAHFLEHAGTARQEAERLAGVLDVQTRSLDEFSNTLPARVSEAEGVLHGVADRLYASEQLAREQAINLSERLVTQIDNLDKLLEKFGARFNDIDATMQQRRSDMDGLAVRISGAANDLAQQLDTTISNLGLRAENAIRQFATVNEEARRSTDSIATALAETAARYASATRDLNIVSDTNKTQLQAITSEINGQLERFEALHNAADQASHDVQSRASAAMQNMQHVLEKLLETRDATQSVGESLTDKMRASVDQNERSIARINEAARMTIHALGVASEALCQQENAISDQAKASESDIRLRIAELESRTKDAEKTMRQQNDALLALLRETEDKLDTANKRLVTFSADAAIPVQTVLRQIEDCTQSGKDALARYSDGMHDQLHRLQQFNARVGSMGDEVGKITSDTLDSIENLNTRFFSLRTQQEETTRSTLDQITSVADRLQKEVGTLGDQSVTAVVSLQKAANDVARQTQDLHRETEDAGMRIKIVTTTLQTEADQIRATLQKQADDLGADLARAENRFTTLGSTLKQQTDAAYALLDRVAVHYDEITRNATTSFETQAQTVETKTLEAQEKVVSLTVSLGQQLQMIGAGAIQMDEQNKSLASSNAKTVADLETVNAKLAATYQATTKGAADAVAQITDSTATFQRQSETINQAATNAITLVQKAGTTFGEEASKLLNTTHHVEEDVRKLTAATSAFAEQSSQIRATMEQHNQRLLSHLQETMAQMDAATSKLQNTASTALIGADQASVKYDEMTRAASSRLAISTQELQDMAARTETAMGALGVSIMQQVASLSSVGAQLNEQNRTLVDAHEGQKNQLLAMFEKLGGAHAQASDVAERTITHLNDTIQKIQTHLGDLSDKSQTAIVHVRDASTSFADQAGMLIQHAVQAEQQARTVLATTSSLQDQAKQLNEALREEGSRTGNLLTVMLEKLGVGSADLRNIGTQTEGVLSVLQSKIESQSAQLNDAMFQISERQRTLTAALDAQRDTLGGLAERLSIVQNETASATERNAARLTESTQQIVRQIENLDAGTRSAIDSIHTASTSFAADATTIGAQAQQAEHQVRALYTQTAALQEQAKDLRTALEGESDKTVSTLGTLIGKLDDGATRVRDSGKIAESVISMLADQVQEKSAQLTATFRDISDRQSLLTNTLDAQRDTLGGLVTRLALSQDEAAAATERNVTRIMDTTDQLAKKMAVIDEKTETSVLAIQTAGAKLSNEAVTLSEQTAKVEAQMRGVVSATTDLQNQAHQIRANMQNDAADVLSQITKVTAQLGATVDMLKTQSSSVINVMDQSVLEFSALAKTTNDTLKKQSDLLSETTLTAEQRVMGVADKMKDHFKLVDDAGSLVEKQAKILSENAEKATSNLVTLCTTLADSDREGHEILANATARLNDTKTSLQNELEKVAQLSLLATEQVTHASKTLSLESDMLRTNLAKSESALSESAALVRQESVQVPALLDRSASKIEETRKMFKSNIDEIGDAMLRTSDKYISTAGAVRDTMADEARNLSAVAAKADETLRQFNQALVDQLALVQSGVGTLTTEQASMVDKAKDTLSQLAASSDRLAQIRAETMQSSEKLVRDFDAMETKAESSAQKLAIIGEAVTKQIGHLTQTTERAEGQMVASSQGFREQLERVRNGVQVQIDDINRGLMQITAQLERTGATLRTASTSTVADVEKISAHFDKTSQETASQLAERTQKMRAATDEVAKLLGGFGEQIDALLSRLSNAGDGIKRNETDLVARLQQAFGHLAAVSDKLESSRNMASTVSDEATRRLRDVAEAIDKQMKSLVDGSHTVTDIVRNVGQTYTDQTQNVTRNVVDAQTQIIAMNKSVDEMQQKTDRMRVTLKLQGDDLIDSLGQILRQLSSAGDMMNDAVDDVLQKRAADTLKKMG